MFLSAANFGPFQSNRLEKQKAPRHLSFPSSRGAYLNHVYSDLFQYLLGAPGVGTLPEICAPLECALVNAAVSVMPLPETCAPSACAFVSAAETVMEAAPGASAAATARDRCNHRRLAIRRHRQS